MIISFRDALRYVGIFFLLLGAGMVAGFAYNGTLDVKAWDEGAREAIVIIPMISVGSLIFVEFLKEHV